MKHLIVIILSLVVYSCTPKVATTVTEPAEEVTPEVVVEKTTPCTTLGELPSSVREEAETAFVLYRDFLKSGNYDESYKYWKSAYYNAPGSNGRIQYHYDDGIKLYRHFYDNTTNPVDKEMWVDSVKALYNKRKECFGDDAYLDGRLGFDLYYYFPGAASDMEIYSLFKNVFDAKGEQADYFIINPFAKILYDKVVDGTISPEEGGKYAKLSIAAVNYGLANCKTDCESWKIVNDYAPARLENLEGIKGLYDCTYYADKYYALYLANPTDCEVVNEAYRRMRWGDCETSHPKLAEVAEAKKKLCTAVVTNEPGPLRQAYDLYEAGKYAEAITGFEDFANSTTDVNKKAKYLLLIAKIYYRDIKKFGKARAYAEQAAAARGGWGEPYMLIGKLYASSGPLCGPGRGWDSQIVTWPAIDMFNKAKSVDPSIAADANKWINTYSQYMPSNEDIFQRRLAVGDSFKVGCWINRSTTVRVAK